jgi:hypothetical protein
MAETCRGAKPRAAKGISRLRTGMSLVHLELRRPTGGAGRTLRFRENASRFRGRRNDESTIARLRPQALLWVGLFQRHSHKARIPRRAAGFMPAVRTAGIKPAARRAERARKPCRAPPQEGPPGTTTMNRHDGYLVSISERMPSDELIARGSGHATDRPGLQCRPTRRPRPPPAVGRAGLSVRAGRPFAILLLLRILLLILFLILIFI